MHTMLQLFIERVCVLNTTISMLVLFVDLEAIFSACQFLFELDILKLYYYVRRSLKGSCDSSMILL